MRTGICIVLCLASLLHHEKRLATASPSETAGLKCPPEIPPTA